MVEPADAKELIDDAIERAEQQRDAAADAERHAERRFRDQVSILIGLLAVALAIVHMVAASSARESLLKGIEASDTYAYMQAKIVRETVLKTAAEFPNPQAPAWRKEAKRLREPDRAGHGIVQLQNQGGQQREEGLRAAAHGEGYELAETALQMAIVLLSIALVARSRRIVVGAASLAAIGVISALATAAGMTLPWAG
jgi:Domain of unknown function (DUF4337)